MQLNGGKVYVNSFTGLQAGNKTPKTLTIYVNATYGGSGPTCGTGYKWTAAVFTGNAFGQETFGQVFPGNTNDTQTAACNYTVALTPAQATVGAATTMTATFGNATNSTASFNTVTLTAPSTITLGSVTLPMGTTATIAGAGTSSVTLTNISPAIAPNGSIAFGLSAAVACGATSPANWTSAAGGFTLSGSNPSTTLNGLCKLQFVEAPANVVTGTKFQIKVEVVDGAGNRITDFGGTVGLLLTGTSTLTSPGTQSASGGVVTVKDIIITGVGGPNTLTVSSSYGSASLSLPSQPFTVYAGGPLNCDPTPPYQFTGVLPPAVTSITQSGYVEGKRGAYNKDGSQCIPVGYTFSNDILSTDLTKRNSVTLRWDTNSQPNAVFVYTMTFLDESVNTSVGIPTSRTKVAWEFNPDGTPKYKVYAVACISPSLPAPYGTLASPLPANTTPTTITINGTGLPTGTFPIAIGPPPTGSNTIERLQATWVSATVGSATYNVLRAQGGTPAAAHAAGAQVMSTPLPLDPNPFMPGSTTIANPYYQKQANMCIADEGWVVVPGGVRFTTTIFDIGDGAVSRDL